jgi:hypothetical protein
MVTTVKNTSSLRKLASSSYFVTPTSLGDIGERRLKRARLSSPMSPHAIQKLRTPLDVGAQVADGVSEVDDNVPVDEVEFDDDGLPYHIVDSLVDVTTLKSEFNVLIPQSDFINFIRDNFVCKECQSTIPERNIVVDRIGCACNVFWTCAASKCQAEGKILSKPSTKEASGKFKKKHPELPSFLGDYDINRQIVLACQ